MTQGLLGYLEPCGCTLERSIGGVDRLAAAASTARAQAPVALLVDGGNTFFEQTRPVPAVQAQALAQARVIADVLRHLDVSAMGVGPTDLAMGIEAWAELVARSGGRATSANLVQEEGGGALAAPWVELSLGDRRVVVSAVVDEQQELPSGVRALSVAAALERLESEAVVQESALRLLFVHGESPALESALERLNLPWMVVRASARDADDRVRDRGALAQLSLQDQARSLGVLQVYGEGVPVRNLRPLSSSARAELQELIRGLDAQLAGLEGEAETSEIAERLRARREEYRRQVEQGEPGVEAGTSGWIWQVISLVPELLVDPEVEAMRRAFNRSLRELNLANAPPPRPARPGQASYVGDAVCASCHASAHAQWSGTHHAAAWATLVEREKEHDLECIGCHVTGYRRPGGSSLGHVEGLMNVQCESCHGPGSLHVRQPTLDALEGGVQREVGPELCVGCHNEEHSPRFEYELWLPRILGPGHGG